MKRVLVTALLCLFGIVAMLAPMVWAREASVEPSAGPPTYTVFATREGLVGRRTANGHIITPRDRFVALPSWQALSSKDGNEFQVCVTYRGRSAILPVWDVGPWNTHDEYWTPQRSRYNDLPAGMPMAQAAYEQNYNYGRDEVGRRVAQPNGIDIADGAFWDDLGMTNNDWVQVTFLWLSPDPANAQCPSTPTSLTPQNEPAKASTLSGGARVRAVLY
jgi:hypothetical protein